MQRIFEKAALALALVAMPLWVGVACAQQPLRMMVGFPPAARPTSSRAWWRNGWAAN